MIFKNKWEKTNKNFKLENLEIQSMLKVAFPEKSLLSSEVISGGCANFNIKVSIEDHSVPYILRIYLRDKDAAYREQGIASLLANGIPVPETLFVGDTDDDRFGIVRFIDGISLRDLLLGNTVSYDLPEIMEEVGLYLSRIESHKFLTSGFFDENLSIKKKVFQSDYLQFGKECLSHSTTKDQIPSFEIAKINGYFDQYYHLLPDEKDCSLVHGDYEPANILVKKINTRWVIAGILDWEFAFSGSFLCDVANMLRYAHHMPVQYEKSFLKGLEEGGLQLPEDWRIRVHLLNLLSLLDCLTRSSPEKRPNQCADICELITHILQKLDE